MLSSHGTAYGHAEVEFVIIFSGGVAYKWLLATGVVDGPTHQEVITGHWTPRVGPTVSVRATPSILKPGKHDEVRE